MSDKVKVVIEIRGGVAYLKEDESLQRTHLEVEVRDYDIQKAHLATAGIHIGPSGEKFWRYSA